MLKVACDRCGKIVETSEGFGEGLKPYHHLSQVRVPEGEPYTIQMEINFPLDQICGECVGNMVLELWEKIWKGGDNDKDNSGGEGTDSDVQSVRAEQQVPESHTHIDPTYPTFGNCGNPDCGLCSSG